MSSDFFPFENPFFSDPFSPFSDPPIIDHHEFLQEIPEFHTHQIHQNPVHQIDCFDQIAPPLLPNSISPPTHHLKNLSICQTTHLEDGFSDCSVFNMGTEECCSSFAPQSYGGDDEEQDGESALKMMQRSYSSKSFEGRNGFLLQPRFDGFMASSSNSLTAAPLMNSPENSCSSVQMRRVCSTGDLQNMKMGEKSEILGSSPSFIGEAMSNFKVGKYSAEERREKINKYRAKRTQRNFNKTIKYACRKTLADNRPRIRGRFAKNDETEEILKSVNFNSFEIEDVLWMDGFQEDDGTINGGPPFNNYGPTQFQYYGYYG